MKKHLLKTLLASVMALIATGAWADEITATLDHTAGAQWGSNTGASTVDAEKEHYNNDAASAWAGCAYAQFSFSIPEGASVTKAELTYYVNQGGRYGRDDIIYYMAKGFTIDYSTFAGQTGTDLRYVDDRAGKAVEKAPTGGVGEQGPLTVDVTDAMKDIVGQGQDYIIFQWTGNAGAADLYGKGSADKAPVLVITTADASTQTTYTVKFTDGTNELKDAVTYDVTIGDEYTASEADMAPIYVNDKKYIYASGNTTATAVAEAESNVITLLFREAEVFNYSVVSNLGNIIAEGSTFEGDAASVPFGKYIVKDGKLYTKDPINKDYHYTFTPTENNQTETLEYKFVPGVLPVFFSEAEAIEGLTATSSANANIRCSMAEGAYNAGEEPVLVTTLPAGTYKIEGQVWGNSGQTLTISCGETTLELATAGYIVTLSTDEFALSEETAVYANGGVDGKCFDYILITSPVFYTVAGTEDLTGFEWDPAQNEMTLNAETGLYEKIFENVTVTAEAKPEFKVVQNGNWDVAWPDNNWVITPEVLEGEGVYTITITFNAETNEIGVTGEKTAEMNVYTATFTTDAAWNQVYAYAWTTTTETTGEGEEQVTNEVTTEFLGAWPGTLLTKNEATGAYEVAIKAVEAPAFIIFNDGAGQQTDNLPFEDGNAYNFVAGQDITVDVPDGDIAVALAAAKEGIAKVGNITINLTKDVTYTVSATLEAPAGITINGNDAIIDASALEAPFIAMANVEEPTKWTEANVRIAGIKMTGLKKALFYSTCKNYIAKDFTVDWVNVEVAANTTLFDFTKGSTAVNFNVTNSTFYAPEATGSAFYSSQSGQKVTEAGDYTQTFKFHNNTMYNLAKSKNFFTHRQANQTWLTYDVQNNIFVDCGKSGQVIKGMNGGQAGKNPTWIIIGNAFNFDDADTSAAEATGDEEETVQNSLAGVITFADAANGDFNGEFTLGEDATAPEAAIGAPAWTITFKEYVAPITDLVIVGDFTGGFPVQDAETGAWDWSMAKAMTQDTENPAIWTLTVEGFEAEAKTYEYKAATGSWEGYQLPAEGNQNWVFAEGSDYPAGKYDLIFTVNTEENTLTLEPRGEDAPELTAPEGWTNAITNGNLAGEDVASYIAKAYPSTDIVAATIVAGAGKSGSHGILVKAGDDTANENYAAWDSQFWIKLNEAVPAGTKVHVEFDYKASQAAKATTQSHGNPGAYQHWAAIGDVNFTTEWQHFSADIDVDDAMAGTKTENGETTVGPGLLSIAFNLQEEKSATDYYFDNFGVWYQKPTVVSDWTDIVVNGDMEGESAECFYVTEQGIGGPFLANITEGIGVDGSKAVKVESYDDPGTDWDSQFFIRLPYQIPAGTKYRVSFDYKADKAGGFDTQSHANPGQYIHWAAVGSGNFSTEWQTYEAEGTIPNECNGEQGNGFLKIFQTIAFNLAKNKVATCFVFDNVKFEVPTEALPTLTLNPDQDPKPYQKPVFNSLAIVGDFLGLEATEEDANPNWNPANGWEMTQDAGNPAVWTLVKDEFTAEAKKYEYKAVANGNWADYVLPADKNADYNFDTANLGAGKYKLTFTADTRKHSVNLDVEKLDVTTYTATFTTDAEWEEVYAYAWSGEEPNVKKFLGDWPGTKLEAVDGVYTVNIMSTDAPEKIIFNNGNSGEGNQTRDLEFENGGTYEYKKPTGEEAAVKLAPEGWTQGVTNGNLAGDDVTNYVSKEYPSSDILGAAIVAGAGKDGSRGILVKAGDDTEHEGAQDWDSQFWIILNDELPSGSKLHVEFDYKASVAATSNTQSHAAPGAYLHWAAIGDVNFTTEWQHFSADVDINDAMAKGDNGNGSGTGMKSIAFNLAVNRNAVDYQFDNFGVWYQKAEPAVTIESMAIVGDFLGLEATEEDTNPNWNPANGWEMEKDAENPAIWTLTKPFTAEAKKYEYKATANGKWGDYELPAEGNQDFVFGTDEYPAGDYKLVFTADTENNTLDLVVKPSTLLTFTATFTTNAYWWDDVYAYAWSGEGENVTEYLGAWPGTKLKVDADGVYTVNVEGEVAPEKIVFNNGNSGEGNQTEDFEFVAEKAYEYVFTPTFDFENNNGQWAEGATFVDGVTMDEVTLTGSSDKVKYTKNQLRVNATHSFTLTAPEGKSITKIELKVLKESEFAFTASTGEVANTKTLKQGDEESQTTVYSIWTWTGNDTEVSFNLTDARQRNLGFINVTTGEITATDIDFTVAEGDIAAALEAEKAKVAKVGNITMRLNKDAAYTIGATLTAPNNFFFYGNDATVTVAAENADPFITLDGTEAFAMKSETEASDHKLIASVEVRGVTVKGLQNALIKDNQKTLVENVVVDYANIEMPANNKNVLDFNGKGYVGKATVTNSTIWAKDKNTGFFVQYGSRPKNINGDWLQEFDFENNTIVNIANGKNFCNFNQKGTAQNVYTVKNNIFVDCGKQNQVVVGFNSGQPSATPEWTVSGNYFEWGGVCVNAAETEKAGKKNEEDIVKDCVDGAVKFADAANGDFNGVFEIDAAATAPESLGAPMWTLNFVKVNTYTVTFTTNAGWEKAYAYAWSGDRETAVKFLGDWPGTEMTPGNGENDWMISFKAEAAPEKIIFNNGDNGAQTADLDFEDGKAYEFTINNEWADAIAAAQALAEEDGVAVGKLIAAIGEAQGIAEPSDEQKAALQTAVDQYKLDNADQEKDETAKVATNGWKKFDGSAAGVCATQYAPAITTYDGRTAQMAECYETNGNRTGTIIYQDITGLTNGKYKVGFYGNAFSTSQRDGFECTMEDGATDVAYVFANEEKEYISARIATSTTENDFRQFDVEVTDGNIKLGMGKDTEKSTNWHTIQIYQLTWFTTAKEVFAQDQEELKAVIAEAKALLADETKTEGKEALEFFVYAAEQAVDSKMINISELEAVIGNLKDIIAGFKKANWYIDFAAGEYYIIDVESGLKMAAGHDWGTRGIVNERGLDLTLTPYTESRTVTIDSRVYNGDTSHFLGENLYMDSSEWGWALEYQGFGFYILEPNGGKYINLDKDNNLVLSDTPREFIIVTKDGVRAQLLEELSEATKDAPVDATGLIVAQNFNRNDARNAEAWIVSEDCTNKNLSGGNNVNNCAESFHSTFTIMQTISDAPAGFYQLTAQGFYRQDEFEGDAPAAPQFFANEVNADVPAKTGSENGMSDASASFTNGLYTIEPINFEVKDDGMMYIGITASTNTQWVIWDNFQLKYFGQENPTTGITTVVVPVAQNDAIYNLSGQKVQNPKKGLYIVNGKKIVLK